MPFVDSVEQALLNHFFQDPDYSPPTTLHVGLSTTTPTDAGGNVTEPAVGAYARVPVGAAQMAAAANTAPADKANGSVLTFPTATANWPGPLTHLIVADALTVGNVLAWAALTVAKTVNNGDTPSIAIGALVFRLGKGTPG